jgi:hypothetical protein
MLLAAGLASAAPAPKLQVFGTGEVTVTGSDSATILNDSGEMGGVFIQPKSQGAKSLDKVTFAFESRGDIQGGAPRFSIPIDDPDVAGNQNGLRLLRRRGLRRRGRPRDKQRFRQHAEPCLYGQLRQ